ncbi:MAG TPA: hypothetical protein VKH43_14730 [Thermoanaerobaculia bacterium]|nr:hypothetical protein [Thermoanaerobaculia bacterium]
MVEAAGPSPQHSPAGKRGRWREAISEARAEISGDVATDIPAPSSGKPAQRVRLYSTPRTPSPVASSGALRQIFRDLSDRSERGDPKALFSKYAAGIAPLAMSIPFTGAGTAVLILVPRKNPGQIMPYVFGAVFALAGLFLFTMGVSAIRAAGAPPRPSAKEPWKTDNAWDPSGARPDAPGRSVAGFLGAALFLLLIGAFNVMWTVKKDLSAWLIVTIVVGLFDLIGLLVIGSIVFTIFQRLRTGAPRLSWRKFPFFTGGRFDARFTPGRALRVTGPVRAILRCVEQATEKDSQGRPEVHPYAIYAQSKTIDAPDGRLRPFDLSFEIPATVPGTDLSTQESTCWLLEIRAPLAGPDFSTQFLLPIYSGT